MGLALAKAHSAADWSTRPLPDEWLAYAALDVELLPRIRDEIARILTDSGKWELAQEEFQAQLTLTPPAPKTEPWRRLSGLHQIRGSRALAIARELWEAREDLAQSTDRAPGRLVPDRALVAAVVANPSSKRELAGLKEFHGRASRSELPRWWSAIERGRATEDLPETRAPSEGPPPPRVWADRNPEAAKRIAAARDVVASLSQEHDIPAENLLTPDYLRRLCWEPPEPATEEAISAFLREKGARPWQVTLVSAPLASAFVDARQSENPATAEES